MVILAHYLQIKKECETSLLEKLKANYKFAYAVYEEDKIIAEKIDIDKSWNFLLEVFRYYKIKDFRDGE